MTPTTTHLYIIKVKTPPGRASKNLYLNIGFSAKTMLKLKGTCDRTRVL